MFDSDYNCTHTWLLLCDCSDFVGSVAIPLEAFRDCQSKDFWYDLTDNDTKKAGKIHIGVTHQPDQGKSIFLTLMTRMSQWCNCTCTLNDVMFGCEM